MLKLRKERYSSYQTKTYRLPVELINEIDKLAGENNTSATQIVIQCLEFALNNLENDNTNE